MTTHSESAPIAHAFDPAARLAEFEAVGGGYTLTDCRFSLMYQVDGRSDDDQQRARQMIHGLSESERTRLVFFLCRRQAGEADHG